MFLVFMQYSVGWTSQAVLALALALAQTGGSVGGIQGAGFTFVSESGLGKLLLSWVCLAS